MTTTKLSSKGQIVIPKEVREAHGWNEGDEFVVQETQDGVVLKLVRRVPRAQLDDVVGCVGYEGPTRTLREMEDGILKAVSERDDRG
jgi:AbrB family looped-hinge helix DNA binding protein